MLVLSLGGCQTLRGMMPSARKAEADRVAYQQLQTRNMRFADEYAGAMVEAAGVARPTLVDARQRELMAGWVLSQVNAAYVAATNESPVVATLDLLTLTVLSRMVLEHSMASRYPAQMAAFLEAQRKLEKQAWVLSRPILKEGDEETLRGLYADWLKRNPSFENVAFVHFQDFVGVDAGPGADQAQFGGLVSLIGLDPLAGLDPAVRQVELSRLLAERATYYGQRLPILMDLQFERALSRVAARPEAQKLQEQSASLTQSVEHFSALAQALPQLLASEREAFIRQVSAALADQQATLLPLLVELRGTLVAGGTMADSVDEATGSIDALVARFEKKPGSSAGTGKPFDITEYTQAAQEIGRASAQLHELLGAVGGQTPSLDKAMDKAVDTSLRTSEALIDYLYLRIAWLIGLLCVAALVVVGVHHGLAKRRNAGSSARVG